jgi:hypothetical protein
MTSCSPFSLNGVMLVAGSAAKTPPLPVGLVSRSAHTPRIENVDKYEPVGKVWYPTCQKPFLASAGSKVAEETDGGAPRTDPVTSAG